MEHKLNPCPFCGEENEIEVIRNETHCIGHGDYVKESYVVCHNCRATGPIYDDWDYPEDKTETLAIEAWNSRAKEV